ncbi:hypothetical protein QSJ18_05295 [Gordonia sp. ABSL1-1]|uniref:hypothetical protein n=1 Tax=Gordonia sp. ABSL1-1 TaxID=3053923 RepID=UPI002572EACC|nr:hypothetical protein [Gordonia sp. ABSL1-1]MDL9936149.1 hypothetical protein [Gordonia sp. ABSL1-1]
MSKLSHSARRFASAAAISAIGVAIALGTTGCGAGQVSQTANQLPAVNGANVNHATEYGLGVRDAQILYPDANADEIYSAGGPFAVTFVVTNVNPTTTYRLKGLTAKTGTITLDPASGPRLTVIPDTALRALADQNTPQATGQALVTHEQHIHATLTSAGTSVAAGLSVPLVFQFEKKVGENWVPVGDLSVLTPVDGSPTLVRKDNGRSAEPAPDDEILNEGHH